MPGTRNQERFEALLQEHRGIIYRLTTTFARHEEDRQDLAQEITIQLWRSFANYDESRAKFSTWLYRIALNVAISQLRRKAPSNLTEPLDRQHLDRIPARPTDPGEDERLPALRAFIEQLDPLNRALILLYLEDRPYAEIADILGITETNVATKLNRIKQKLKKELNHEPRT